MCECVSVCVCACAHIKGLNGRYGFQKVKSVLFHSFYRDLFVFDLAKRSFGAATLSRMTLSLKQNICLKSSVSLARLTPGPNVIKRFLSVIYDFL